jgi:hypothetical protein
VKWWSVAHFNCLISKKLSDAKNLEDLFNLCACCLKCFLWPDGTVALFTLFCVKIGSITASQSVTGRLNILVSQPGGAFVTLVPNTSQSLSSCADSPHSNATDFNSDNTGSVYGTLCLISLNCNFAIVTLRMTSVHQTDVDFSWNRLLLLYNILHQMIILNY